MTETDRKFMRQAIDLSIENVRNGGGPFGAVIVRNGEVVATGVNNVVPHCDPTAHAEMIAITAATESMGGKYLSDCTLYVTVEPCPMCAGALAWAQMGRIVYGAPDQRRGYSLFSPSLLHPRTEAVGSILQEECAALMLDFFREKRG